MPYGRKSCTACGGREYAALATACPRCADFGAQVADWMGANCPASVSGQGGHVAALKAAGALWGFYTTEEGVMAELRNWNVGCSPAWSEAELRHKVREARKGLRGEPGFLIWEPWRPGGGGGNTAAPERRTTGGGQVRPLAEEEEAGVPVFSRKGLPFDAGKLREASAAVGPVSREELQRRSVCRLDSVTPEFFLSSLYLPGERVLVFTKFASQGQYLWQVPGGKSGAGLDGAWKLSGRPGEAAQRAAAGLPREGNCGVWFLNQPVDGKWREKSGSQFTKKPEYTRRSENCVTGWPYMVLESDISGIEEQWISFLCGLRWPVVALYTSGGESVHALVRVDAVTKHHWDVLRDKMKSYLTLHGADPGVFSAVRLTRLPGTMRHGTEGKEGYVRYAQPRRQELIYFNPQAEGEGTILGR